MSKQLCPFKFFSKAVEFNENGFVETGATCEGKDCSLWINIGSLNGESLSGCSLKLSTVNSIANSMFSHMKRDVLMSSSDNAKEEGGE